MLSPQIGFMLSPQIRFFHLPQIGFFHLSQSWFIRSPLISFLIQPRNLARHFHESKSLTRINLTK